MNLKTFLLLSLAANVVLALALVRKPAAPASLPSGPESTVAAPTPPPNKAESKATTVQPAPVRQTNTVAKVMETTFGWEAVESPDYMEYIKNLRSVGCPEETIRDIIIADVNKLYEQKKKQMPVKRKEFEFWKPGIGAIGAADTAYQEAVKKLDEEKNNLLRALGIEPDEKQTQMASILDPVDAMLSFLDEDKKVKVLELIARTQEKATRITAKGRDRMIEAFRLQTEMEKTLAGILSPEEYQDYLLRMSMTANVMRNTIDGFDPSKEEFLEVFKLRRTHEETYSMVARLTETPEEKVQREKAEAVLKTQLQQALGDERYRDYEMSQDGRFQEAYAAAKRSGLTVNEARSAWEMRKEAERQAKNLRENAELSAAARQTALEQIRNEAMTSIKELYGEQGWQNYQRGSGAAWLQRMTKAN